MKICRHFGTCGGCSFQDMPDDAYRALKRSFIVDALAQQGLADIAVDDAVEVPPHTRRRAVFKIAKRGGAVLCGFHAAASHAIVDMRECLVIAPRLFALVAQLRELFGAILSDGETAEVHATETDAGIDMAMRWERKLNTRLSAQIGQWAQAHNIARVISNGDIAAEFATPGIVFGKARVVLPSENFLQPTRAGEAALLSRVVDAVKNAKSVADLFAGCGTFALPLAQKARVHAVELDKPSLAALANAARATQGLKPVTTGGARSVQAAFVGARTQTLRRCSAGPAARRRTRAGQGARRIARPPHCLCVMQCRELRPRRACAGGWRLSRRRRRSCGPVPLVVAY